ncbi:MAG: SHOCT domain-containing protein [Actinomycetota bacterium]|nr:SHOCT domain-containing protein [Actinomycetota bacterium]
MACSAWIHVDTFGFESLPLRQVQHAVNQQKAFRAYVQEASADGSTADELEKLGKLKDQGVLTSDEFDAQKAKLLA